jgi:hypothetical protein
MKLVEFLELVGRLAVEHAKETGKERLPLVTKYEPVMDSLFAVVRAERRIVVIPDPDVSDTDPDY